MVKKLLNVYFTHKKAQFGESVAVNAVLIITCWAMSRIVDIIIFEARVEELLL